MSLSGPEDLPGVDDLLGSFRWYDAFCINQYDAEERGKQVAMMKRIFNQAKRTQLWLGEEDKIATQAFELIKCFRCIPTTTPINPVMFVLMGLDVEEIRRRFFGVFPQAVGRIPPVSDPRWRAVFQSVDRPWFSRLWVFQEAILSSTNMFDIVVCGQMTASFFHLYLARSLVFVDWEVESLPPGFEMVRQLMLYYYHRNLEALPPISFTVWQIGGRLSSGDSRDRIYGLLGVQNPEKELEFEIDYKKSVQDVYIDFTLRCIEQNKGLRVLELKKEIKRKGIPNLPSWVPDWSVEAATTPFEGSKIELALPSRFNASASLSHIESQSTLEPRHRLVVKGKIIDYVVTEIEHDFQIGTPIQIERYFSVNFHVKAWAMFIEHGIKLGLVSEATTGQLQAAVIRTLTVDGFIDSLASLDVQETTPRGLSDADAIEIYHELERLREMSSNGVPLPQDWSELKKDMHRKVWVNTELCKGRGVAVLMKHWIMLGPSQARKGDCIAVLNGSSIPWVLREHGDGSEYYEVVGQCFVDGVMYGETVSWNEDEADNFVLV